MAKEFPTSLSLGVLGFSGGVGWKVDDSEREAVRSLLAYLEDRRILFKPNYGDRDACVESMNEIRRQCTSALGQLDHNSSAHAAIRGLRAACRRFVDSREEFQLALGECRGVVGLHIAALSAAYKLPVEDELASIVPQDSDSVALNLVPITAHAPTLVRAAGARASYRLLEFFTAQIRNPNTRRAYARAAKEFFD